jgi:hypothetical protein
MDNKRASSGIPKLWISMKIDLVGEHSINRRSRKITDCGGCRKANVGISNDKAGEKPAHRKTKVS